MVALSLALHVVLFVTAIMYTRIRPHVGRHLGQNWGTGSATRVNTVSSLPGVPLPAPMLTTRSTVATENAGLYKTEPVPKEQAPAEVEIPKFQRETRPEKTLRIHKRIQKEALEVPENAVPFGVGGRPSMSYSQFVNTAGEGGLSFEGGAFGERYGWYVTAVRSRISNNWLLSTISPSIVSAPRVYITFDILSDGTLRDAQIARSSGLPEVDRSALRAVLASNPLGPLPREYPGDKVSVEFYFDFRRR